MKKILKTSYLVVAFAFFLTSCNQEVIPGSTPDVEDRRVVFNTSLPVITTKAAITTNLDFFLLTVFDESDGDFKNEEGKLDEYVDSLKIQEGPNGFVSYDCLWPDLKHEKDILHFFAYNPELPGGASLLNNTSVNAEEVSIGYKVNGYSIATDFAEQVDFVTAYATGSMFDNYRSGIDLNFKHHMSRIEVKAWGANKSCDIEIAGVRIGGINVKGDFDFTTSAWSGQMKGIVEHIFQDEELVILSQKDDSHATSETAASIMGANPGDENNCAMIIPTSDETGWDFANDRTNSNKGMFLSVLLRIIDKTPTDGKGQVRYPYPDNDYSQGLNAMNIPREYFAVVKATGIVSKRLYKNGDSYFTDEALTQPYTLAPGEEIREFGWASLPISGNWQPGYSYTYTLDYTSGVGLHGPDVAGSTSPKAGDPVISDIVGVSVSVNEWQGDNKGNNNTIDEIKVP